MKFAPSRASAAAWRVSWAAILFFRLCAQLARVWVSSHPEFSKLVNEIGVRCGLDPFLGAGAMCLQRNTAVERLVAHKKGRSYPRPFSTPHLTDPTIAVFFNLSVAAGPIANNFVANSDGLLDARAGWQRQEGDRSQGR
jgi:hypothetical protein